MDVLVILLTFALVASLLAGTAILSSTQAAGQGKPFDSRQAIRLRTVLIGSTAVLIAALIPPPLLLLGLEHDLGWRISSGIASLLVLAINIDARNAAKKARSIEETNKNVIAATLILAGATFGCFLLGVVADYPAFWFVTALLLTLMACLLNALRLLFSLPPFDALRD